MSEAVEDLRATSEAIAAEAERLRVIEERKQRLDGADPALQELSAEAERIARSILPKAVAQRELAAEAAADAQEPEPAS